MNSLFEEYNTADIKPILQIGSYFIGKYKKVEPKEKKKRGITNERQSVLKEIQNIIEIENGAKMSKDEMKRFAMKLSHIPTEDLYFMKSEGLDYRNRKKQPFAKYIYGSVKPKKI